MRLRSAQWYEGQGRNACVHRAWMRRGAPDGAFTGRPQIAIADTASDLTPCNAHLNEVAVSVRNGLYEAGGFHLLRVSTTGCAGAEKPSHWYRTNGRLGSGYR